MSDLSMKQCISISKIIGKKANISKTKDLEAFVHYTATVLFNEANHHSIETSNDTKENIKEYARVVKLFLNEVVKKNNESDLYSQYIDSITNTLLSSLD